MAGTCDEASRPLAARSPGLRLGLLVCFALEIERHCGADKILQGRLFDLVAFVDVDDAPDIPSRPELNRPEGSGNAAPLANVSLTMFLYVSPVQTMPPWEKTGVPGDVFLAHFRSSTISGSAL